MINVTEIKEGQTKGEIKGRSLRIFDEDYKLFKELSKESGLTQADLMNEFRKSYERLKLENQSSYGQSLEDLRSYSDKIINLFTTLVNSTEDKISNEQTKAIEAEKKYEKQIVKVDEIKSEYVAKNKLLEKQVKELTAKLGEYSTLEEMIDSRIQDKDQIIESKDKEIATLTEKVERLRNAEDDFKKSREINTELKEQLVATEEKLKLMQQQLIDNEHAAKVALLNQKEELQSHYNKELQAMHDKRDQAVREAEARVFALFQRQDGTPTTQKKTTAKKRAPKETE